MNLFELTTSSAIPNIVRPFSLRKRGRSRLIAIDALARLSDRLKGKLRVRKKRKRDKDSILNGLM